MSNTMQKATEDFQIERRSKLSYAEFSREYLFPLKPVIITGALEQWPALKRWTPEFFQQEFAGMRFSIPSAEYGQAGFKDARPPEYVMEQFIDLVLNSSPEQPAPYLRNKVLYDMFPSLKADIQPIPDYVQPNWLGDHYLVNRVREVLNRGDKIELYIGGRGAKFPVLHYDGAGTHAFLMQIYGRKEYIVFPPEQEPWMYVAPNKRNLSLLNDVENPDLEKFPLFRNARATRFFLDPGETLFVPSHWWHTAKILSPSITVSFNVLNQSNWHEFVEYVTKGQNPLVALASRPYFALAGGYRSWRDRSWIARGTA